MMSPHSLFLILLLLVALLSFLFYRLRPRAFMKSVRWLDQRSGGAIIVLGVTVFVGGCLGFASVGNNGSRTATANVLADETPTNSTLAGAIYETFRIFAFNADPGVLGKAWPIFVWIPRQRELSQLLLEQQNLQSKDTEKSCQLIPFGQCYGSVSYNELNDSWMDCLARHLHLVWMGQDDPNWTDSIGRFQAALQQLSVVESPTADDGDQPDDQSEIEPNSIPSENALRELADLNWEEINKVSKRVWEGCDEWSRASNRSCAAHAVLKAAALGLKITGYTKKPSVTPRELSVSPELEERLRMMEHYRWVAERLLTGWRYDEDRSSIRKTRWQITPWSGLDNPPEKVVAEAMDKRKTLKEKMKDEKIVRMLIALIQIDMLTTIPISRR